MNACIQHGIALDRNGVCAQCAEDAGLRLRSGEQRDHDHATRARGRTVVDVASAPESRRHLDQHPITHPVDAAVRADQAGASLGLFANVDQVQASVTRGHERYRQGREGQDRSQR